MLYSELCQSEPAASPLAELESQKNRAADHVWETESEQAKLNAKFLSLKEQVSELQVHKKSASVVLVTVCTHRDSLNDELISPRTKVERLRVTLAAKTDFVKLLKERMTLKEASLVWERKDSEAKLARAESLLDAASSEMTTYRDLPKDGVHHLSSIRGHLLSR